MYGASARTVASVRDPAPATGRRIVGLMLVCLVGVALYVTADTRDAREGLPLLLTAAALQTLPLLVEKRTDLFSPAAFTGFITLVGLVGIVFAIVLTGRIDFGILPTIGATGRIELLNQVSLAYILGGSCYFAGYYLTTSGSTGARVPDKTAHRWSSGRLRLLAFVCSAAFVGAYGYFQARVGTSVADLDLGAGKAVWREDPTLSWLHRGVGLGLVPPLFYAAVLLGQPKSHKLLILTVVCLGLAFLVTRIGQRGLATFFALNLLVLAHYLWRPVPPWLLLGGTLAAVGASNVLGQLRLGVDTSEAKLQASRLQVGRVFAAHEADRQRLGAAAVVMYYFPDRHDFLLGKSWLGLLVAPIPRWVYPEKLEYTEWADTAIVWHLVEAPIPSSYQFTLYANFGWFGVAFGMFAWGAFHRGLRGWHKRHEGDRRVTLLYSSVLIYFGPTMIQIAGSLQTVVPIAAGIWFITRGSSAVAVTRPVRRT